MSVCLCAGCHPFKSLPESHLSKTRLTQDQPPSVPARSWPRYQSFPKFSHDTPPAEKSRPHTYPLNNLSGTGSNGGGSCRLQEARTESWNGFGELVGSEGLPGLRDVHRHKDSFRQHVHSEPQEHAEEGANLMDNAQGGKDGFHQYRSNGVAETHLGRALCIDANLPGFRLNTLPPRPQDFGNTRVKQNDQDSVDGMDRICSLRAELPLPDIAPPRNLNHTAPGFVNHDDLTQFADSLQLEVVKLRESLAGKEQQVWELQELVRSLTAQNADLQRLADDKRNASAEEVLALRERELSDLKMKICEVEKQNVCLQQALIEQQTQSTAARRQDDEVSELTARVSDLERMNSGLQQLMVSQQDRMSEILASRDREISQLKSTVDALSQEAASLRQLAEAKWQGRSVGVADCQRSVVSQGSFTASRERPARLPDSSGAACERPVQSADSSTAASTKSMMTPASLPPWLEGEMASESSVSQEEGGVARRSVVRFCDQSAPHPAHAHATSSHPLRLTGAGSPMTSAGFATSQMMTSSGSAGACDLPPLSAARQTSSAPEWDTRVAQMRAVVSGLFGQEVDAGKLDVDGREWTVGREFQLLESKPVNCATDGQRRGSNSLVFSIKHQGRKYMLKVRALLSSQPPGNSFVHPRSYCITLACMRGFQLDGYEEEIPRTYGTIPKDCNTTHKQQNGTWPHPRCLCLVFCSLISYLLIISAHKCALVSRFVSISDDSVPLGVGSSQQLVLLAWGCCFVPLLFLPFFLLD